MRAIRKAERDRSSLGTQSVPAPCRLYLHQPWVLSSLCCCFSALSVLSLQPGGACLFHSTYRGFVDQHIHEALIRLPREKVIAPFLPINTDSSYDALHDGYLNISFMSILSFLIMWHEFIDTFILVELNLLLIHIFFRDAVLDLEKPLRGFPGGPGVKNPPANAGDMGSVLGPGRCCKAQSS